MEDQEPTSTLKGSQRKWLRGRAHALEPVVHVGKEGVTDAIVEAVAQALLAHELVKVKFHAPENKKAMAAELAQRTGAVLAGLVGHVAILYRPHPDKPRIVVPS